jgi:phage FluMu protein Com
MKTPMICLECGHKFSRVIKATTIEVKCPKCKGYDTDLA